MLLVTLGSGIKLGRLHAHVVKCGMHAHKLMRPGHAPRSAKAGGREAADAPAFRSTAADTAACKRILAIGLEPKSLHEPLENKEHAEGREHT